MNVFPPKLECLFALLHELVPLIDRGHAGNRPGLVVEDLVGNVRRDAQRAPSRKPRSGEDREVSSRTRLRRSSSLAFAFEYP